MCSYSSDGTAAQILFTGKSTASIRPLVGGEDERSSLGAELRKVSDQKFFHSPVRNGLIRI